VKRIILTKREEFASIYLAKPDIDTQWMEASLTDDNAALFG